MGKFFTCCRIQIKFLSKLRLKPWKDRGEFDWSRSKLISSNIRVHWLPKRTVDLRNVHGSNYWTQKEKNPMTTSSLRNSYYEERLYWLKIGDPMIRKHRDMHRYSYTRNTVAFGFQVIISIFNIQLLISILMVPYIKHYSTASEKRNRALIRPNGNCKLLRVYGRWDIEKAGNLS